MKKILVVAILLIWLPLALFGLAFIYTAKFINFIGYGMTLNFRSAMDQISWRIELNPVDVLDRFHFLRKGVKS